MKLKIFGGLLVAALAITSMAQAQTHTPVINHRQHRQERRINQGVRSGELTRNETRHLRSDERRIGRQKRIAMAERQGQNRAERRHLRRDENRTSRAIYRDKHNDIEIILFKSNLSFQLSVPVFAGALFLLPEKAILFYLCNPKLWRGV